MAHTFTSSLHRPALHRPALHRRARSGATVIAGPDRFSRPPSVPTTSIAPRLRTFCSRRLSSGSARLEVVNPGPSLRDPGEELSSDDGVERDRRGKWTVAGGGHHVAPVLGHDDLAGQVADPAWSAHALRWRARPDASTCGRVTSGANTPAERLTKLRALEAAPFYKHPAAARNRVRGDGGSTAEPRAPPQTGWRRRPRDC